MPFVPPMPPQMFVTADDATASIAAVVTVPVSTTPLGSFDATYGEILTAAPTYGDWAALWPTYADLDAWNPPAPATTTVDVYRREGEAGAGIRIAAGLDPDEGFTDWTPASEVIYQYRATAHAVSNGTSTDGAWTTTPGGSSSGYSASYEGTYG